MTPLSGTPLRTLGRSCGSQFVAAQHRTASGCRRDAASSCWDATTLSHIAGHATLQAAHGLTIFADKVTCRLAICWGNQPPPRVAVWLHTNLLDGCPAAGRLCRMLAPMQEVLQSYASTPVCLMGRGRSGAQVCYMAPGRSDALMARAWHHHHHAGTLAKRCVSWHASLLASGYAALCARHSHESTRQKRTRLAARCSQGHALPPLAGQARSHSVYASTVCSLRAAVPCACHTKR
jgi:hypothetical protein